MKFKISQRISGPLQRDKPTHPQAQAPLIQPLTLSLPATRDNTINHSLRAARWARGGGKWERAQGKELPLETARAGAASPCQKNWASPNRRF